MLMMKRGRRKLQLTRTLDDPRFLSPKPDDADDADGPLPLRAIHTSPSACQKRIDDLRVGGKHRQHRQGRQVGKAPPASEPCPLPW